MKRVLQFSGAISLALAVVAFILMMVTNAIIVGSGQLQVVYPGTYAIFGHQGSGLLEASYKPSVLALIGWILAMVGMIVTLLGVVLPLLKVKGVEKFAGLMNLCAVACFVVAGIFMFLVVPTFAAANEWNGTDNCAIGAGWVIGGIVFMVAGGFAISPAAVDFFGKKKKRK